MQPSILTKKDIEDIKNSYKIKTKGRHGTGRTNTLMDIM